MKKRIESFADQLLRRGMGWVALNPGPSLRYLTGLSFHLMERPVVVLVGSSGQVKVILPELERAKVADLPFNADITTFGDDPATWQRVFEKALSDISDKPLRVGVEPTRLRFLELDLLRKALPEAEFVEGSAALAELRMRKGEDELKAMRYAAIIAQNALLNTLETVKPGQSELQISAELMVQLFRAGSESELPFAPIVSSGPNSANPHASPTDRVLQEGEMLLIDWGASFDGVFSDITRIFFCGEPNDEMKQIADLVEKANAAARLGGEPACRQGRWTSWQGASSPQVDLANISPTAPGMGSEWRRTSRLTSTRAILSSLSQAWSSPSNRASTCPASTACALKTMSSWIRTACAA